MVHFHATVNQHVSSQVPAVLTSHCPGATQGATQPVLARYPSPFWRAQPESTPHDGSGMRVLSNLMDQMGNFDSRAPQVDCAADQGRGAVGVELSGRGKPTFGWAEVDRDPLALPPDILGDEMRGQVFVAIRKLGMVAVALAGAIVEVRSRVPKLVALRLAGMPAHPPFEHGTGH